MDVIKSCWCLRLLQHYSPGSISVLEELIVSQLVTKVLYFMKLEELWKFWKMSTKRKQGEDSKTVKKPASHWAMGLLMSMKDPELFIKEDDTVVIIKDKYPKAQYHFLVLPKENVSSLVKVTKEHLQLLKHMDKVGQEIAESYSNSVFKLGYHAEPSMSRLHLHVISDDFNSTCLKTKKHWNTFTTDFFLPSSKVISEVETQGKITPVTSDKVKKLMETPLKCHKCSFLAKNMPTLKSHILVHLKKLSGI